MSEETTVMTDSASHLRNAARVKRDEAELAQLLKEHKNGPAQEEESYGEGFDEAEVQASDNTQQKEANPQSKAPSEDAALTKEEESFKKRYGDLRRHAQEKEQQLKLEIEKLQQQVTAAVKKELVLPKSQEEIEAWAKKYPDVAAIVEAIADKKAQERSSDIDRRLSEIEELRIQAKRDKAEAELMGLHPDFAEIRRSDAFHDWAEKQPKWVQDALYENVDDARSVARVIDLYKSDTGVTTRKTTSSDKAAASSVNARARNTPETDETKSYFRESQVNKMSTKEYEQNADAIMEAIRSGKFVYDVSGRK